MLKSRLEIAQFKVGRSWQNLPFKSVEPQLEREVKLRQPESFPNHDYERRTTLDSPPGEPAFLVPDLPSRGRVTVNEAPATTSNHNGATSLNHAHGTRQGSSPLKRHRSPTPEYDLPAPGPSPLKYRASNINIRDRMTPSSPPPTMMTTTNGTHRFTTPPPPPSTPPASHLRSSRVPSSSSAGKADTEEGADLLLYLATSPSPAKSRRSHRGLLDFSSPPPAPMRGSSAVNTPVGAGFNLSEFLNFSPSPAQVARIGPRFERDALLGGNTAGVGGGSGAIAAAAASSATTGSTDRLGLGHGTFQPARLTYEDSPTSRMPTRQWDGL